VLNLSGLSQSCSADPPWVVLVAHGGNSMAPLKWSRIYIPWDRSEHIQLENLGAFIKVGLGISRTNGDSQWNPVYNAFHRIFCRGNETIRQ